jgi:hypothetical protein
VTTEAKANEGKNKVNVVGLMDTHFNEKVQYIIESRRLTPFLFAGPALKRKTKRICQNGEPEAFNDTFHPFIIQQYSKAFSR